MLVCYPYTPANRSDVLALARTHLMYLASVDSLHPSSINHTDAHTSSKRMYKLSIRGEFLNRGFLLMEWTWGKWPSLTHGVKTKIVPDD